MKRYTCSIVCWIWARRSSYQFLLGKLLPQDSVRRLGLPIPTVMSARRKSHWNFLIRLCQIVPEKAHKMSRNYHPRGQSLGSKKVSNGKLINRNWPFWNSICTGNTLWAWSFTSGGNLSLAQNFSRPWFHSTNKKYRNWWKDLTRLPKPQWPLCKTNMCKPASSCIKKIKPIRKCKSINMSLTCVRW